MDKSEILRLVLVPIVGGLIFIAKKVFDEWFKDRRRWQSPETEEYRKMLDGKFLDEGVQNLLVKRYNIDAFYIATGTRAFTYEEIPSMVAFLNRKESLISDRTLRMIYPKFLRFEGDRPSIHIRVSDRIENAVLWFFEMYLIGAFTLGFWYAFDKDSLRIAVMAGGGAVLIAGLVGLEVLRLPYRRAKDVAKITNDAGD